MADDPYANGARRDELAANLAELRTRIASGCARVDRDPAELTTIAITKTFPASDVRLLAELGLTDVGENRDQDATAKHAECADLPLRWHFVGQLQRNKCRSVARYADVVHSIDRPELVTALSRGAESAGRVCTALVQVSFDPPGAAGRGGADPAEVERLAELIEAAPGLRLGGVMTVAPLSTAAQRAAPQRCFAELAAIAQRLRQHYPAAGMVSAGMTGDLEAAIANGATHLRVGTALLGRRSRVVG